MLTETVILAVVILAVGIPIAISLFAILKALRISADGMSQIDATLTSTSHDFLKSNADRSTRSESLAREVSTAIGSATSKSVLALEAMAESLRRVEQRIAEAMALGDVQAKEDRQVSQSIAADSRQAIRQASDVLKDRIDELKDRVGSISAALHNEALESRKWSAEKASEILALHNDVFTTENTKLIAKLEVVGQQIESRLDQGSRLLAKTTEAKADELGTHLKGLAGLQVEFRAIASQLEQNRNVLDNLRKSIIADVSSLTGE